MTVRPRVAMTLTQVAHRVPGGSSTSLCDLASAVVAAGDVELVTVLAKGSVRRPRSILNPLRDGRERLDQRVGSVAMGLPLPLLYESWGRTGRPEIAAAAGRVDLVHVTLPMKVGIGSVPMVATVHDVFPLTREHEFTSRGARLMRSGLRWVLANARIVMVPSETVRSAAVQQGLPEDRAVVVPWGVHERRSSVDACDVRRRFGLAGPYVLFVGTLEPRKNLRGLLGAMALLDRADLTLVVVGPKGWGEVLDPGVLPASPVVMLGHVPESDLDALYRGASAFCYPSFEEGFGLPVLEAMAAGAPVITSAGTATADVAGEAAILVDPHDRRSIADALRRLLDDAELGGRLRSLGHQRASEHTWSAAAAATVDVYRRALEASGAR